WRVRHECDMVRSRCRARPLFERGRISWRRSPPRVLKGRRFLARTIIFTPALRLEVLLPGELGSYVDRLAITRHARPNEQPAAGHVLQSFVDVLALAMVSSLTRQAVVVLLSAAGIGYEFSGGIRASAAAAFPAIGRIIEIAELQDPHE